MTCLRQQALEIILMQDADAKAAAVRALPPVLQIDDDARCRTLAEPAGVPEQAPVGGRLKCAATFRRMGNTWRFLNLAEAAYAPFRFFVSDFERDAEDGFAGMPRRVAP